MNDSVIPFLLENAPVRGRIVRLDDTLHTILSRHEYPRCVANLLTEALVAASMLASQLAEGGILTLQMKGSGPVPLLVADAVYGGALRGYAEIAPESRMALEALPQASPQQLVGEDGYLAITLDLGGGAQRYQGVVALEGDSLAESLNSYFLNSQQLAVAFRFAHGAYEGGEGARPIAGGLMLERLADEGEKNLALTSEESDEAWRYANAVFHTLTKEELSDSALDMQALLFRLFHEQGVRAFAPTLLSVGCRCSRERIVNLLRSMDQSDRLDMIVDGEVSVHCQFCNKTERFLPPEIGLAIH